MIVLAVWFLLRWTVTPGDTAIGGYQFERGNAATPWSACNVYRNPMTLELLVPPPAGGPDSGFVSITADPQNALGWRHGGTAIRMRAVDVTNHAADKWSNYVIVATAMPDTNFTDGRAWIRAGRTGGIARFAWAVDDTVLDAFGAPGPLLHQESVQLATRPTLCHDYGYWCLRGARQPCP